MPAKRKKSSKTKKEIEEFPPGTILEDFSKETFILDEKIYSGDWSRFYLTQKPPQLLPDDEEPAEVPVVEPRFVIKIAPQENEAFFKEVNFYMKHCKKAEIEDFCKKKKLKNVGIPKFVSWGFHESNQKQFVFLVMPQLGQNLEHVLKETKIFSRNFCAKIALKMLNALEFLHEKRCVHGDIKGENILLGSQLEMEELFLIDFGLAYFIPKNVVEANDQKTRHDGTLEYCSTDCHKGSFQSFRGDLEILCWCLSHWSAGFLPWLQLAEKDKIEDGDKEQIEEQKKRALINPKAFLKELELEDRIEILELLSYCKMMEYHDEIDFDVCKKIFEKVPKTEEIKIVREVSKKKPAKKVQNKKAKVPKDSEPVTEPIQRRMSTRRSLKRSISPVLSKEHDSSKVEKISENLDFSKMKVAELKNFAKKLGLKNYSKLRKQELVDLLKSK